MIKRPYYPTKAEWAASMAQDLRRRARLYPTVRASDWRGVRRRVAAVRSLNSDADRYDRMASAYKARGQ